MGCAIVAIPDERDRVWDISSEKIPHMTLLFLGDVNENQAEISQFVQHVAETSLQPFGMSVKKRGVLGEDQADVLFFDQKDYNLPQIKQARDFLLTNAHIRRYYDSVEQYPEWTPHLTLGYPNAPAKKVKEEDRYSLSWVEFNKIAVWFGDFDGPTFDLEYKRDPMEVEPIYMSDMVRSFLEHYGVKGMKWGVRKSSVADGETLVTQKKPGGRLTVEGGRKVPASEDAMKAASSKQRAKYSGTDALSTKDLQELVNRMNLEQQYSNLTSKNKSNAFGDGQKVVKQVLAAGKTYNEIQNFLNTPGGKIIKDTINTAVKAKVARR